MSTLLDSCEKHFGSRNLYEVLTITKDATPSEIRKAYKKLSLKVHPDRVDAEEKETATEAFKALGKIHVILTDTEKRKVYDDTGCVDDDDGDLDSRNWYEYWRLLFKEVTLQDVENHKITYKGSDTEKRDIKKAYEIGKGCMNFIYDSVPFMVLEEEERVRGIIREMISNKEVEEYPEFTNESPRKKARRERKLTREAAEAEEELEKIKKRKSKSQDSPDGGLGDLASAILSRQKDRESQADLFFKNLEAKFCRGGRRVKKK